MKKKYFTEEDRLEAKRKRNRKYYYNNKEAFIAKAKKWKENNPEKYAKIQAKRAKKYKENNPEKYAKEQARAIKKWRKNNPEKYAKIKARYEKRARENLYDSYLYKRFKAVYGKENIEHFPTVKGIIKESLKIKRLVNERKAQ